MDAVVFYAVFAVVASAVAYGGYRLNHYVELAPPTWFVAIYALVVFSVFGGFTWTGVAIIGPWLGLPLGLFVSMPAIIMLSVLVNSKAADALTDTLFGQHFVSPAPSDFGKARKKASDGDIEGALPEYRLYFEAEPQRPAALFAAALLAEQKAKYDLAAAFYRDIMRQFEDHPQAWARSAFRLAIIQDRHFRDGAGAEKLMREILRKARRTDESRDAMHYLLDREEKARLKQ